VSLLAIDVGNSRVKWGVHDLTGWVTQGAVNTAELRELAAQWSTLAGPSAVIASNVAGAAVAAEIENALTGSGVKPRWIEATAFECGVTSSYAEPQRLGADRWAALIGARKLFPGACIVVNAGTTLTADALTADGVFLGGCIVPGLDLMRRALALNTAQLPLQDGAFRYFPDNTADAIASGARNALAGAVERMQRYLAETGGAAASIVLSGGNAPALAPLLNAPVELVDNLVLEGLVCLATGRGLKG
jgi:type III pantothenate kinase